ncbi:MAG TPA: S41 family peptidase [Bacteroidia bacterium]|nr:S41 family peptidase [Bacteroidia bacterium]HNU32381.1 S41 family peptidase [Bacteroidia bacterium]
MNEQSKQRKIFQPIIFAIVLGLGFFLGSYLTSSQFTSRNIFFKTNNNQFNKINDVVSYIEQEYVDTINEKKLVDKSIEDLLQNLDPHSAYIPLEDVQAVNEPLEGNFEGIGIEFHIQYDTIMVVTTISGGPSEAVGLRAGDRIIAVDDKNIAGIKISNEDVFKKLRGPGGTKVKVSVLRRGVSKPITFNITRGKIPVRSIDVAFMVDAETGYIKISRFAATTVSEYKEAFAKLKSKGLKNMIVDLRGNPGGYLDAATALSDEFLPAEKLIVYTQGRARNKTKHFSTSEGDFENGSLAILIDEGSASASEIVAGAVQDWDRGTVVGRRSFGKGLVQEQTVFPDGSAMRLTVARYYTPTGRSIQKSYKDGIEDYNDELEKRFKHGEFKSADSIQFADSLKYKTPGGKIVYGGGGIMPDVFIPLDTTSDNEFTRGIFAMGLVPDFAYDYVDKNRMMLKAYPSFEVFNKKFTVTNNLFDDFVSLAIKNKVPVNGNNIALSRSLVTNQLKAFIARQLFGNDGFYPVVLSDDKAFKKAVDIVRVVE